MKLRSWNQFTYTDLDGLNCNPGFGIVIYGFSDAVGGRRICSCGSMSRADEGHNPCADCGNTT